MEPLDFPASPMEVNSGTAKFDLTLYLSETGQGLTTTWQYNTDLFDEYPNCTDGREFPDSRWKGSWTIPSPLFPSCHC